VIDLACLDDLDPASLSDQDALALATVLEAQVQLERWEAIADAFPRQETWPYPHEPAFAWRREAAGLLGADPKLGMGADAYYSTRPKAFISHWCVTYDPRLAGSGRPAKLPFLLFPRQEDMIDWLLALLAGEENGLLEKARDMGATWLACAFSVWLWKYRRGSAVGWGSRKEALVDKLGDPDSIFEKMRMIIDALPGALQPHGFARADHMTYMKIINPENGATITGEAGDNIGRGGRKLIYFKDESAHYERPEKIEAALADNTRVQIDFSSVNGLGNVFHRKREAGKDWAGETDLERGRTSVFVMDWRDHPGKTQDWYDTRRQSAIDNGLLHIFAQEVERNYAAAVEGTIIPAEWVRSAIDAHIKLGFTDAGPWGAALDVADGGGDTNALAGRKGVVLRHADNWGARDTGVTTRKAVEFCSDKGHVDLQYDCIGVGAGVKAEANRLEEEELLPPYMSFVPWNAGAAVQDPDAHVIPEDRDSPTNRDFFRNFKAQAMWSLRGRFERTHRAVTEGIRYDPDTLISIDSKIPLLRQIEKELSQPTATKDPITGKMMVDKTPEGTRSPNLADAIVMAYNPLPGLKPVITISAKQFGVAPFKVPPHWKKAFAMKVQAERVCALWAAHDPDGDVLYLTTEYSRDFAEPSTHAQAILARGAWVPGTFESDESNVKESDQLLILYHGLGLTLAPAEKALEASVSDLQQRIATGRLKAFTTCQTFFTEYRSWRRDAEGRIIGGGLMDCARNLARPDTVRRMVVEPKKAMLASQRTPNIYS